MGKFTGKILLEIKVGHSNPFTATPFRYVTDDGEEIDVPAGMRTDLASIPKGFRWLIGKVERHIPAALVHDHLYQIAYMPRKRADQIFLEAMEASGVSRWKRRLMYAAVRAGGGFTENYRNG